MHLEPGTETDIKLSLKKVTRMPSPYSSRCRDNFPNSWDQTPYNAQRCRAYCYIESVKKICNCTTTAFFEGTTNRELYEKSRFCLTSNPCFGQWLGMVFKGGVQGVHEMCDMCTPECNTSNFIVSLSYPTWKINFRYQGPFFRAPSLKQNGPQRTFCLFWYKKPG